MTEPVEPSTPVGEPVEQAPEEPATPEPKGSVVRRWVKGRRSRLILPGVAAVLVLGGTVLVTAVAVHHGERGFGMRAIAVGPDGMQLPGKGRVVVNGQGGYGGVVVKDQQFTKGQQFAQVPLPGPGPDGTQPVPQQLPATGSTGGSSPPHRCPCCPPTRPRRRRPVL